MGKVIPKRLILLSDIHGLQNAKWIKDYHKILSTEFEVITYCILELANIEISLPVQEKHHLLVNGGMEKAAKQLLQKEKETVTVIGFSVGGSIAWKAALLGLKVDCLYAISSTRIRKENRKPNTEIKLIFGGEDTNTPDELWYQKVEIIPKILAGSRHECYMEKDFIRDFSSQVNWANGIIY